MIGNLKSNTGYIVYNVLHSRKGGAQLKKSKWVKVIETYPNGTELSYHKKDKNRKGGFRIMYPKDLGDAIELISHSKAAIKIFFELVDRTNKNGVIPNFTQQELADQVGVTRKTANTAIKMLKQENIIAEINGLLYFNPFIIMPSNQTGDEAHELQQMWEKEIGYYENAKRRK